MTSWSSFVGMANVGWSIFNWKSIEFCILYSAHLILLISLHCICSIKGQFCKTWGQIFYLGDTLKTKYAGNWLHTKLCEIILWDIYTETRKMSGSLAIITKIKYNSQPSQAQAPSPLVLWLKKISQFDSWLYTDGVVFTGSRGLCGISGYTRCWVFVIKSCVHVSMPAKCDRRNATSE